MAKNAKKAKPKPEPSIRSKAETVKPPALTVSSLVATEAPHSQPVNVTFTFTGGLGQATAVLFRRGVLINMQSVSNSGNVNFSNVQTGDVIAVNGVCAGNAVVAINTDTVPDCPEEFTAGLIIASYLIK